MQGVGGGRGVRVGREGVGEGWRKRGKKEGGGKHNGEVV